jgi:hypothetical protein
MFIIDGKNYDVMKLVGGFPRCKETESGKFIWNNGDTEFGVDVPAWKQISYDIDCGDELECIETCRSYYNAEYINGKKGKKCYAYQVKFDL